MPKLDYGANRYLLSLRRAASVPHFAQKGSTIERPIEVGNASREPNISDVAATRNQQAGPRSEDSLSSAELRTVDMSVYYGPFQALNKISMEVPEREVTAIIGPIGVRKEHPATGVQPHERPHTRCQDRGKGPVQERRHLRFQRGPHRDPVPHRHGFPATQPLPQVHLRQRGLRPTHKRLHWQPRRRRGMGPAPSSPVG